MALVMKLQICILLYAADKPKFVIDAYTTRIMSCIGVEGNYGKLQKLFESALPQDVTMFKRVPCTYR